jgi:hypothetical protein
MLSSPLLVLSIFGLLLLLIVAATAIVRILLGLKPATHQSLLEWLVAIPRMQSVIMTVTVVIAVSALFFWLQNSWNHGPAP